MNSRDSGAQALAREVAERLGLQINYTRRLLDVAWLALGQLLEKRGIVRVPGFGVFEVRERKARVIRTPQGVATMLPPMKEIRFRPSRLLTERVTGRRPS